MLTDINLHPGVAIAIRRFTMTELDVARAMVAGELSSPQRVDGYHLFAIRITGTGTSYRSALDEHVYRPPEVYLTQEFIDRCNGLPVVWLHPEKKPGIDSEEWQKRSVGTVFLPYILGDEVWGIAKIYDAEAISAMQTDQLSTSPGVSFRPTDGNITVETDDGKTLLIEGRPSTLDHIAIAPYGVWDKGGAPAGVVSTTTGDPAAMAEETEAERKAREDAARRDAGGNIDKVLSHLDSISKRLDAFETREKEREETEKDRARKDRQKLFDSEHEEWKKHDAAMCAKDDAEEEGERERMKKEGENEDAAFDKARAARRDRMNARRDAEMSEEEKMDAERKREDAARRDAETKAAADRAAAIAADTSRFAAIVAGMPKVTSDADYAACIAAQSRADASAYQPHGERAPAPLQGETAMAYRVRLARGLQQHSKAWRGVDLAMLPETALAVAETQIFHDSALAALNPDVPTGQMIERVKTDPHTGLRTIEFFGRETFFKQLNRPSPRVVGRFGVRKEA